MMKIDFFFFVLWLAAACTFSNKEVKKNSKQENNWFWGWGRVYDHAHLMLI